MKSLTQALVLLEALAHSHDGLALIELAQIVGLAPTTVHRLLTALARRRFVRFDAAASVWQVGVQAFAVGSAFMRTRNVVAIAQSHMRRLMEDTGETVNLYVADEGEGVCMSQVECRQLMRAMARPGGRVMMHCSGVGKAMLAWLPEREVASVLERHGMPLATDKTLATPQALGEDLAQVRLRGYAVDDEEHAAGLRCVAAPILDEHGRPLAGLSVSGPTARLPDQRLSLLGTLVAAAARAATAEVGSLSNAQQSWRGAAPRRHLVEKK